MKLVFKLGEYGDISVDTTDLTTMRHLRDVMAEAVEGLTVWLDGSYPASTAPHGTKTDGTPKAKPGPKPRRAVKRPRRKPSRRNTSRP